VGAVLVLALAQGAALTEEEIFDIEALCFSNIISMVTTVPEIVYIQYGSMVIWGCWTRVWTLPRLVALQRLRLII